MHRDATTLYTLCGAYHDARYLFLRAPRCSRQDRKLLSFTRYCAIGSNQFKIYRYTGSLVEIFRDFE